MWSCEADRYGWILMNWVELIVHQPLLEEERDEGKGREGRGGVRVVR